MTVWRNVWVAGSLCGRTPDGPMSDGTTSGGTMSGGRMLENRLSGPLKARQCLINI